MKLINQHIILLLTLLLQLLVSCDRCGNKLEEQITQTKSPGAFHSIDIEGRFLITVCQDSTYTTTLKGAEGLLSNVEMEIQDSILKVSNNNTCRFLNSYEDQITLEIGMGLIKGMTFENPQSFKTCGVIKAHRLELKLIDCAQETTVSGQFDQIILRVDLGSSNVKLSGRTRFIDIDHRSYGHVYARELETGTVFSKSNSTGDIYVRPSDRLSAKLGGSGNVYYSGNPTLEVEIDPTASGKVVRE